MQIISEGQLGECSKANPSAIEEFIYARIDACFRHLAYMRPSEVLELRIPARSAMLLTKQNPCLRRAFIDGILARLEAIAKSRP